MSPVKMKEKRDDQIKNDIKKMLDVKDGWGEPSDKAVSKNLLSKILKYMKNNLPSEMPAPFMFPLTDGGVALDWNTKGGKVIASLLFRNSLKNFKMVPLNLIGTIRIKKDKYCCLDMESKKDWAFLKEIVLNGYKEGSC